MCADDTYYNLESLSLVFDNLQLQNYVEMFDDGRQLLDYFIQSYEQYLKNDR